MLSKRILVALVLALVLLLSGVLLVTFAGHGPPGSHLVAVGPINPEHGFPIWYTDSNGLTLELCLDEINQDLCLLMLPDPNSPISFPTNFGDEAFWWAADALMSTKSGGRALLTLALEAAFFNGDVVDGDQVSFGRVRIRVDNLLPGGTYTVTHPYGVDVFENVEGGSRGINFSEDIGGLAGDFDSALKSRIGPFLTWDTYPGDPDLPPGFVGNPLIDHTITGSPFGTNFFRIEGPPGSFSGSDLCADPALGGDLLDTTDCIETDLFALMGKVTTIAGVGVASATYSGGSAGFIDVIAFSQPGQELHASGPVSTTSMLEEGATGRYFARIAYSGNHPASVIIRNVTDVPPYAVAVPVTDQVIVTTADYDADTGDLTIEAFSSDQSTSPPVLEAFGEYGNGRASLGLLTAGSLVIPGVIVPPRKIIVESSYGGSDTQPVQVAGSGFAPLPVAADAGPDQTVLQGQSVTLDGTGSQGDITQYMWDQTAGPVSISGLPSSGPTFSFTAPVAAGLYTFTLTVDGPGGPSTDSMGVTVEPASTPVCNAGAPQIALPGALVTLDGSASTGALTFTWDQTAGPVTIAGLPSSGPSFSFTAPPKADVPTTEDVYTFELTVTGPGGSDACTVDVTVPEDILTITDAQFRASGGQWLIVGTSTVAGPPEVPGGPGGPGNTITIYIGPTTGGNPVVLGTADVDDLGDWRFRVRRSLIAPDLTQTISIKSSAGGKLEGFPVTVKN